MFLEGEPGGATSGARSSIDEILCISLNIGFSSIATFLGVGFARATVETRNTVLEQFPPCVLLGPDSFHTLNDFFCLRI